MKYLIDEIKKAVRTALEINNVSTTLLDADDVDTLSMDDVIESKIIPAIRHIESNAAVYLLDAGKSIDSPISWDDEDNPGTGSGYLILPDDFMRLTVFQMTDWKRQATIITQDSPLYPLQSSEWSGLKGNPETPVVAIVPTAFGVALEIHSCTAGEKAGIKHARYIPQPYIDEHDMISICIKLYEAVILYIASMVATTYSNATLSEQLKQQAYEQADIFSQTAPATTDSQE